MLPEKALRRLELNVVELLNKVEVVDALAAALILWNGGDQHRGYLINKSACAGGSRIFIVLDQQRKSTVILSVKPY